MNARTDGMLLVRLAGLAAGACVLAAGLAGCSAPAATLGLIDVARDGLADAARAQREHYQQSLDQLDHQRAALDAAFDADVRAAAAGAIKDADGEPVPLDPQWVISARKGYAAARDLLVGQQQRHAEAHHARLDNIAAATEALDLATELILDRTRLADEARAVLRDLYRRNTHE